MSSSPPPTATTSSWHRSESTQSPHRSITQSGARAAHHLPSSCCRSALPGGTRPQSRWIRSAVDLPRIAVLPE